MNTVSCKSCKKPITFAVTKKGHRTPIDPEPVADGSGNIVLQQSLGGDLPLATVVEAGKGTHVSHFVTCPYASQHRRS